jgi:uncharacterized protein
MSLCIFDTSALVKYYVPEPGSLWVTNLIEARDATSGLPISTIFVAAISIAEVAAALSVIHRQGVISHRHREKAYSRFLADFDNRFSLLAMPVQDFYAAAELSQKHPLKAYDAVQLAVALRHSQLLSQRGLTLTFVSGDNALLSAARAEGLLIENPFDHVSPQDTPA